MVILVNLSVTQAIPPRIARYIIWSSRLGCLLTQQFSTKASNKPNPSKRQNVAGGKVILCNIVRYRPTPLHGGIN